MERSRKIKYSVGGQWETSMHPLSALFHLFLVSERPILQDVAFATGMSVAEPTPLQSYGLKYVDLKQLFTLTKCHVIFNLRYSRNLY